MTCHNTEDDPPAPFGMELGEFKDCSSLQEDVTELLNWIVNNLKSRTQFKRYNLNGRESADYDNYC
ncbi:hypothetical protein PGT21_014784 [Puccinia graminis f. sp. tritici]|uniref:Uncharacterized protein n=1 Tax=Puccinia graminis f. sp. tritici TaxID=56615 RepID=A0A5B0NM69_PUCGR|nr:hypothetical protein PGT21_014784 [Puccinia graminis f. sp. tritici]KAA1089883.1 hypothetical protein PGTUg99_026650 [Puccinia graminis f. sp. tritici]